MKLEWKGDHWITFPLTLVLGTLKPSLFKKQQQKKPNENQKSPPATTLLLPCLHCAPFLPLPHLCLQMRSSHVTIKLHLWIHFSIFFPGKSALLKLRSLEAILFTFYLSDFIVHIFFCLCLLISSLYEETFKERFSNLLETMECIFHFFYFTNSFKGILTTCKNFRHLSKTSI